MDAAENAPPVIPNYGEWLTLKEVAERVGVGPASVWGWITRGFRTESGVIRLPAAKIGWKWKVDPAAVEPFIRRMTAAHLPPSAGGDARPEVMPAVESPAEERRRIDACLERLRKKGIGVPPVRRVTDTNPPAKPTEGKR